MADVVSVYEGIQAIIHDSLVDIEVARRLGAHARYEVSLRKRSELFHDSHQQSFDVRLCFSEVHGPVRSIAFTLKDTNGQVAL